MQQDAQRTRIWFPLFSFFESKCDGIVPNEYEWPFQLSWMKKVVKKKMFILNNAKTK